MKLYKKILLIIAIIAVIAGIGYVSYSYVQKATFKAQNPVATIEVENFGTIKIELYPDKAENTVSNFITLANRGIYDGTTFHRTIPDFMIQGGDKKGDGTGMPTLADLKDGGDSSKTYAIKGEFIANGYNKNTIKLEKGVLAMARSDYSSLSSSLLTEGYNSAGSQFFIMNADNTSLNGLYAGFGKVIEGLDIVEKIANLEVVTRDTNAETGIDKPVNPPVMTSVRVETYGIDYGVPTTVEPFDYYSWMTQNYSSSSNQ